MDSKGVNQVDFAVAISVLILVLVYTLTHVSSYYNNPLQEIKNSKLYVDGIYLHRSLFEDKGVPSYWHWENSTTRPSLGMEIYKVPVHIEEVEGNSVSENVEVHIDPGNSYNRSNAWNGSIKVYQNSVPVESTVTNEIDNDDDGFLDEFDVVFNVDIDAFESKTYYIYYSQDNTTSANHTPLSPDTHDLQVTVNKALEIVGLTDYKLDMMSKMHFEEVKEKFDLDRNFNISVGDDVFTYGAKIPTTTTVHRYDKDKLYQNSTAHIRNVNAEVAVW